jgi:hypothetical protein
MGIHTNLQADMFRITNGAKADVRVSFMHND